MEKCSFFLVSQDLRSYVNGEVNEGLCKKFKTKRSCKNEECVMAKKVFLVLVSLVLALSFSAFAQAAASDDSTDVNYFTQWDTDGNGSLSQEEFVKGYSADVASMQEKGEDTMGSGDAIKALFNKADTDGNGELSQEEFDAAAAEL